MSVSIQRLILFSAFFCGFLPHPCTSESLPFENRLAGSNIRQTLAPLQELINQQSVAIYSKNKAVLFGTIVHPDGYILTKASAFVPLKDVFLRQKAQKITAFSVVAYDADWDLLLLKIAHTALPAIEFLPEADLDFSLGTWVVSNGGTSRRERRVRAGIISANTRMLINKQIFALGIVLEHTPSSPKLIIKNQLKPGPLMPGDQLLAINETPLNTPLELLQTLHPLKEGSQVLLNVQRKNKVLSIKVPLQPSLNKNDLLSGSFSSRRSFFKRVLQHSTLMSAKNVGGPLLNLEGQCLGMTIANANRSENFAIPINELHSVSMRLIQEAQERDLKDIPQSKLKKDIPFLEPSH